MYNAEQKSNFIRDYTENLNVASSMQSFFNATEYYETKYNKDLCEMSAEELYNLISSILGKSYNSQITVRSKLRAYAKWCLSNNIRGASDNILNIQIQSIDKSKLQLVANPRQLQLWLNTVFEPEDFETMDNVYRIYFWFAFSGMTEQQLPELTNNNIDIKRMKINFGNKSYTLYTESLPALLNCMELDSFRYVHPKYNSNVRKKRVDSDLLLRGYRANPNLSTLRSVINHNVKIAVDNGRTNMRLSFERVAQSGLFYSMYEDERAGAIINYGSAVIRATENGVYSFNDVWTKDVLIRETTNRIKHDYEMWKSTFNID